jgi:hypothetical protein
MAAILRARVRRAISGRVPWATRASYSGFGIETYSSGEHRCVQGELQ